MKTKKIFIPGFYTQRSIITYRMQRKRSCRHNKNTDNTDGSRNRSRYKKSGYKNPGTGNYRNFRHEAG